LILGPSSAKNLVSKQIDRERFRARAKGIEYILTIALFIVVPLLGVSAVVAQSSAKQEPSSCETNITILSAAHQAAGKDLLIAIARLGDGERNRELNRRRLHNVGTHISEFANARAPETIVTAEGERVSGLGRVELYAGGKLFYSLLVPRDGDLLVGSCYYEIDSKLDKDRQKNLYPWRHGKQKGK
jgi:hypothetical protein